LSVEVVEFAFSVEVSAGGLSAGALLEDFAALGAVAGGNDPVLLE
jgi:hypothetical protein